MSDDHTHFSVKNLESKKNKKALIYCLAVAFIFMFVEVLGGYFASSLALMSDALHMFSDVAAFLASLIAMQIAQKKSSHQMTYGWKRAEVVGALLSSAFLLALLCFLAYEAIRRFFFPEKVMGLVVFVIAVIGLLANIFMMLILQGKKGLNIKAAYLHVLGDLLGSIGVILAGLIIWFFALDFIDPLVTLLFAFIIISSAFKIIKQSLRILMNATPKGMDVKQMEKDLLAIQGVSEIHDLHIWAMDEGNNALSCHLVADLPEKILKDASTLLETKYRIVHSTLQVEDKEHFEQRRCRDCSNGNQ